jgi:hypothetical protein
MFKRKSQTDPELDNAIASIYEEMKVLTSDDDAYADMVKQLAALTKLREETRPRGVSADTLAIIAGNLVTTVLILRHEQVNTISTKAMSFVSKLR